MQVNFCSHHVLYMYHVQFMVDRLYIEQGGHFGLIILKVSTDIEVNLKF